MTFRTSFAAWWIAWKYVAIIGLLLILSLLLNLHQYGSKRAAKAQARADTLEDVVKVTAGMARHAQKDNSKLLAELEAIAERGQETRIIYRKAAAKRPLAPNCAPGQDRMDAVNAGADR